MVKMTRYCDICGKEISKNFNIFSESPNFYQIPLPEQNSDGEIVLSSSEKDICKKCFKELFWKISEIKYPEGSCPF